MENEDIIQRIEILEKMCNDDGYKFVLKNAHESYYDYETRLLDYYYQCTRKMHEDRAQRLEKEFKFSIGMTKEILALFINGDIHNMETTTAMYLVMYCGYIPDNRINSLSFSELCITLMRNRHLTFYDKLKLSYLMLLSNVKYITLDDLSCL